MKGIPPYSVEVREAATAGPSDVNFCLPQRVHVGIWYILRAQKGSHTPTLRPKYTPYSYMDPLGCNNLRE